STEQFAPKALAVGALPSGHVERCKGAYENFPCARRQKKKSELRLPEQPPVGDRKTQDGGRAQHHGQMPSEQLPSEHHKQREEDIVLLLDPQAPRMKQWLELRCQRP